jgi:hypothetical protein
VVTNGSSRVLQIQSDGTRHCTAAQLCQIPSSSNGHQHLGARPVRELRGQRTDRPQHTVHQHGLAADRPVGEDGPVRRDTRDAEAGSGLIVHLVRQVDSLAVGDDRELGRRTERPVGLRAVHPDTAAHSGGIDAPADGVHDARAVAVRNDPREGHRRSKPPATLLGVARVDPGVPNADSNLARTGFGFAQLAEGQHLTCGSLPVVPDGAHGASSRVATRVADAGTYVYVSCSNQV